MRFYYAIVQEDRFGNLVCIGTVDSFRERTDENYIQTDTYDESLISRKMWTGAEWIDNPNYNELSPEQEEVL